ncbi:MAG: hypothetical protein R3B07_04365 [Polyangiaceae bacterium]
MLRGILSVHVVSTCCLLGLIWFVQLVHYPLLGRVGSPSFAEYEVEHVTRTGWIAAPLMLLELGSLLGLLWLRPPGVPATWLWLNLALLGIIWVSTFLVQVPCHNALTSGFDPVVHQRLVSSNWIRTVGWSVRGLLVFWLLNRP